MVEADAAGGGQEQGVLDGGIGEQAVDETAPAVVEGDRRGDLVEHVDPRRQPGLDGVLGQQPLGEAVQRPDGGAVELVERRGHPPRHVVAGRRLRLQVVEAAADPVAQLGRGLLGERDGGHVLEPCPTRGDQLDDAVDQGARLSRPGRRLHEQRVVEGLGDAVACRLVGWVDRRGDGRRGRVGGGGGHGAAASSGSASSA